MYDMEPVEFEAEVFACVAGLPRAIAEQIRNVAFGIDDGAADLDLLGLYEGVPLTSRTGHYSLALPDTITIFRLPILLRCTTREDVFDAVEVTVKHEIGHYFGISDHRLHELGWA
jgi:predicted Zn-dependent protease with MMP-like domain